MVDLLALADQPEHVAWPTTEWPEGDLRRTLGAAGEVQLTELVETAMRGSDELGATDALLLAHRGQIVVERYGAEADRDTALLSWSMAKSVTHAAVGIAVRDGLLEPSLPAPVAAWVGDARRAITLDHLLHMRDGLSFTEDYEHDDGDAVRMLFGDGAADVAAYAAARPLVHDPGEHYHYSSGTSNIVARILCDVVGSGPDGIGAWLRRELFEVIGAGSFELGYDAAGTFVGSTFVHATARDYARFGLCYLRGGTWDGHEVVARSWVDDARTPTTAEVAPEDDYRHGAHWWCWDDGHGTFAAHGFGGQRIAVVPALDLVLVRIGRTPTTTYPVLRRLLDAIVACFARSDADEAREE